MKNASRKNLGRLINRLENAYVIALMQGNEVKAQQIKRELEAAINESGMAAFLA